MEEPIEQMCMIIQETASQCMTEAKNVGHILGTLKKLEALHYALVLMNEYKNSSED